MLEQFGIEQCGPGCSADGIVREHSEFPIEQPTGTQTPDYGAVWAQDHLRKSLGLAGARVLEAELAVPKAPDRFAGPNGELTDPETRERLGELVKDLVAQQNGLAAAAA